MPAKMRVFLVLLLVCAASAAPVEKYATKTETEVKALFHDYIVQHGRVYHSASEFQTRFANFKESLARIDRKNAEDSTAVFGITRFSDMTTEEFKSSHLMPQGLAPFAHKAPHRVHAPEYRSVPGSVDWRAKIGTYMTPVRNQGQCGACWAFSVTENVESVWALANNTLHYGAVQQIVDCDTQDGGCGGGDPSGAYAYVIKAKGLENDKSYPYTAENGQCKVNSNDFVMHISSWKVIAGQGEDLLKGDAAIQAMQEHVVTQPLSICVEADTWQDYSSGILSSNCGDQLDHCVILAGYVSGDATPYWIVRNSWGTDWGVEGYIYIAMKDNLCGIQDEVTTAIA